MTISRLRSSIPVDPYIAAIVGMVGLATLLPLHGVGTAIGGHATDVAIALLFFLHGARLSTTEALVGARHWRLHLVIFLATFGLFPLLGLAAHALAPHLLTPALWTGVILICILPSTVQSSVAFTSIAGGNVSAALCSATASNLVGIVATPLLAGALLSSHGGFSGTAALDIVVQLLLPFLAGQLSRPLIGGWVIGHHRLLGLVDRGSILLIVYTAFSDGVSHGIWHQVNATQMVTVFGIDMVLLALVLLITHFGSGLLGFSREDRIAIMFCGSKKSLASGLPMASLMLAGQPVGLIVLPLMLFHQIQLMTCAALARSYGGHAQAGSGETGGALLQAH
ncbi:bile acid:sodium symporter family protein [Bradyrhizobium jicamae]|uniref:bile acid:sodium symporter family protein n=1 Tax=Bradyrhizobium jicamae TaxID=280332 RepID=UPI001BA59642|nr:bile acid:sodium symporter family protein [Bradyrhizobium jicamae]MBR0936373.1 bile acid:sodium symporter [Bradyrhizobium jicamae]